MKNKMTILSDELAPQSIDTDGALEYGSGKAALNQFENIQCNIQEKSKESIALNLGKEEEDYTTIIYHQSKALKNYKPRDNNNQNSLWIICNKDNPFALIDMNDVQRNQRDYDIFEFKGHIQQIRAKRTNFYILRAKRTYKWNI
jgi:hypothetical protein